MKKLTLCSVILLTLHGSAYGAEEHNKNDDERNSLLQHPTQKTLPKHKGRITQDDLTEDEKNLHMDFIFETLISRPNGIPMIVRRHYNTHKEQQFLKKLIKNRSQQKKKPS